MIISKPLHKGAKSQTPSRIVLHAMSEYILYNDEYIHAHKFLKKIGLSAHALVCPNGDIIRCREDEQGAYHAKGYNKNSLGVEFLVEGKHSYASFLEAISSYYLTLEQHIEGVELLRGWCRKWDIKSIDSHSVLSPSRKFDPGEGFPLEQFLKDIKLGV